MPDDAVGTVELLLGVPQSHFDDCVADGTKCIEKKLQWDLAYYIRTGAFPSAVDRAKGAAPGSPTCDVTAGGTVCFEPSRIQYMGQIFGEPPVNKAMNPSKKRKKHARGSNEDDTLLCALLLLALP